VLDSFLKPQNNQELKMAKKAGVESVIRDNKRRTKNHYNAEEKISIVLEGLRGEIQ